MMKNLIYTLVTLSLPVFACIDPPTPITLAESSFANADFKVSSSGLQHENARIFFDLEKNKWCVKQDGKLVCDFHYILITDSKNNDKVVGVIFVDNKNKTATLKQVKNSNKVGQYEVDEGATVIRFKDASDPLTDDLGSNVFIAEAVNVLGQSLGKVVSQHSRAAKVLSTPGKKENDKVDLSSSTAYVAGCGGATVTTTEERRPTGKLILESEAHP